MKRIGIFGGTFDPIHLGHAALAQSVFADFRLDELVFMPAKLPPHKVSTSASPENRFQMVQLTASILRGCYTVSDYELSQQGISYTYLTLKHWRDMYPDDALFFICGTDIFYTIEHWQNWRELFNLANFIVVNRDGVTFEQLRKGIPEELLTRIYSSKNYPNSTYGSIILYDMDPVLISSTQIRGKMAEGRCPELLTEEVYEYIIKNNLYTKRTGGAMDSTATAKLIKKLIDDRLGENIVCLDLRSISSVTDYLIIASGKADTHVKAISGYVIDELKKDGVRPYASEGMTVGTWACVDYGDVIVHIMRKQERDTYNLEGIWGGAPRLGD